MSFLSKINFHFKFRIRQVFRSITSDFRLSISSFLIVLAVVITKLPSIYYSILFIFPIIVFHTTRKDISFLKISFGNHWRYLILIENLILFGFFSFFNTNYKYNLTTLVYVGLVIIISFFNKKLNLTFFSDWNLIPSSLFEWRSYLRKNTILIILFYPLLIASAYNITTLFIGLLFIMDPIIHVFKHNESKEMLEVYFTKISLNEKLKKNMIFLNIGLTPLYILFTLLHLNSFYILFFYIVVLNLFYLLIMTRKYALYSHNRQTTKYYYTSTYYQNLFLSILIIPAITSIKENFNTGIKTINEYVRNSKH